MTLEQFLDAIEQFLVRHEAHGMTPTRFGKEALNDPSFVFDLRDSREPRTSVRERAISFMERFEDELQSESGEAA